MKKIMLVVLSVILLAGPACAQDAAPADELQELKAVVQKQEAVIQSLLARIETLEGRVAQMDVNAPVEPAPAAKWTDKISFKGDFRYRHELIDEQNQKNRYRDRIRARVDADAGLSDNLRVGLQFSSGGDDPVSNNQSLDESFSTKGLQLSLAYMDWTPGSSHVAMGKIKNPFTTPGSSELIWDSDLHPEGAFYEYSNSSDRGAFFANIGGFWVEERAGIGNSGLFGAQTGYRFNPGGGSELLVGAGFFDYGSMKDVPVNYFSFWDFYGNSNNSNGEYLYDFKELELFTEYKTRWNATPVSLYLDYVKNTAADDNDRGWLLGFETGKCKRPGSWEGRINYRRIESDAVFGLFTDSDFIGGGTGGRGYELGLGYQVAPGVKAALSWFQNDHGLTDSTKYNRLQLDMSYKF